jgi:hypothetical protein
MATSPESPGSPSLTAPICEVLLQLLSSVLRSAETASSWVILSSSRNEVSSSSDRTTYLFPLSRCASTIQSVRPSESMAETQPKLQPALLSLSAMISQHRFTAAFLAEFLESGAITTTARSVHMLTANVLTVRGGYLADSVDDDPSATVP